MDCDGQETRADPRARKPKTCLFKGLVGTLLRFEMLHEYGNNKNFEFWRIPRPLRPLFQGAFWL